MTPPRLRTLKKKIRREAALLAESAGRLAALGASIPRPDAEELRAMEEGLTPHSVEAYLIDVLAEMAAAVSDAGTELEGRTLEVAKERVLRGRWLLGRRRRLEKWNWHIAGTKKGVSVV
jgi:hypothetical protein